ncbi:hypothetical protein HDU96_005898, partial [Phlyctochytrium bullatum]
MFRRTTDQRPSPSPSPDVSEEAPSPPLLPIVTTDTDPAAPASPSPGVLPSTSPLASGSANPLAFQRSWQIGVFAKGLSNGSLSVPPSPANRPLERLDDADPTPDPLLLTPSGRSRSASAALKSSTTTPTSMPTDPARLPSWSPLPEPTLDASTVVAPPESLSLPPPYATSSRHDAAETSQPGTSSSTTPVFGPDEDDDNDFRRPLLAAPRINSSSASSLASAGSRRNRGGLLTVPGGVPGREQDTDGRSTLASSVRSARPPTPLPWAKTLVISVVLFCNSFNTTVLLPFIAFMVEDFGVAPSPEDVGKYSGFMLASYMAGQMIFSYPWGVAADVWGRKPSLLVGLLGSCVCTILFGFAPSFAIALVLRFICGSLNGIVSITKTTLSEITDSTNQGTAFGVLGVARAVGLVLGPAVGGVLSQVDEKYPKYFPPGSLFAKFPYAIPCLIGGIISGLGFIAAVFVLEETRKWPKPRLPSSTSASPSVSAPSSPNPQRLASPNVIPPSPALFRAYKTVKPKPAGGATVNETTPLLRPPSPTHGALPMVVETEAEDAAKGAATPAAAAQQDVEAAVATEEEKRMTVWDMLSDRSISLTIYMYALISGLYIQYDEVFSLWAKEPFHGGGLNFSTTDLGLVFTVGGAFLLVYQLCVYPPLERHLGALKTFRWGVVLSIPVFFALPNVALVGGLAPPPWGDDAEGGTAPSGPDNFTMVTAAAMGAVGQGGGHTTMQKVIKIFHNNISVSPTPQTGNVDWGIVAVTYGVLQAAVLGILESYIVWCAWKFGNVAWRSRTGSFQFILVYLALFIFAQGFLALGVFDAAWNKNSMQILACSVFNVAIFGYSIVQIDQIEDYRSCIHLFKQVAISPETLRIVYTSFSSIIASSGRNGAGSGDWEGTDYFLVTGGTEYPNGTLMPHTLTSGGFPLRGHCPWYIPKDEGTVYYDVNASLLTTPEVQAVLGPWGTVAAAPGATALGSTVRLNLGLPGVASWRFNMSGNVVARLQEGVGFVDSAKNAQISVSVISGVGNIIGAILAYKAYQAYGWSIYQIQGASVMKRKMLQRYHIFILLLKLNIYFTLGIVAQLVSASYYEQKHSFDQNSQLSMLFNSTELFGAVEPRPFSTMFILPSASIAIIVAAMYYAVGWFAIRRANFAMMWVFMVFMVLDLVAVVGAMSIVMIWKRFRLTRNGMLTFCLVQIILNVITLVVGAFNMQDFKNGLRHL